MTELTKGFVKAVLFVFISVMDFFFYYPVVALIIPLMFGACYYLLKGNLSDAKRKTPSLFILLNTVLWLAFAAILYWFRSDESPVGREWRIDLFLSLPLVFLFLPAGLWSLWLLMRKKNQKTEG